MTTEEEEVHTLGARIGFGNMMSLASKCWEKVIKAENYPSGGEFVVGPCRAMTTTCVCIDEKQHSYGCDYCMGCGWLTTTVKKLILESKPCPDILSLLNKIRDDLLLRGEIDTDDTRIVNMSFSIWGELTDTIEYLEENRG